MWIREWWARHRATLFSICAIASSSVLPLAAQSVQRDPTALAVLSAALTPTRPAAVLILDSSADGQVLFANGTNGPIQTITQGSRRIRYEVSLQNKRLTSVIKDGQGYRVINTVRNSFPDWVTAYQSVDHIPLLSRIQDYIDPNVKVIDLGTVTFAGRVCNEIRLSVQPVNGDPVAEDLMSELHVFIDTQNKEIVGTRGFLFSPEAIENRSTVDRVYSDYRSVNGIPIPFRVDQYISGRPDSVIIWSSIRLNTGVLPQLFD
jgi:hypothetical protein